MLDKNLNNEEKLDAIYKMSLENYEILNSLRRQQYMANFLRLFYLLVIVGAIGGSYLYVRPFISKLAENKDKVQQIFNNLNQLQLPDAVLFDKAVESIKGGVNQTR